MNYTRFVSYIILLLVTCFQNLMISFIPPLLLFFILQKLLTRYRTKLTISHGNERLS